jgi:predicted ATPase
MTARHPVKPFAARRDRRPPSTRAQRLKPTLSCPSCPRRFAAELKRQKGGLLLRQGHFEAAEELYRKALSIAEEQGAKLWELRAAASLARLRRDQGRRGEARDLLASVYGWFTEGFATPDLKAAKALLDELV